MNVSSMIRDASKIHAALKELPDGRVIALEECKIYSPTRYVERRLAYVGAEIYILGIYGITVQDAYYGVSLLNTMIPIEPTLTNRVSIRGEEYNEYVFKPGAVVFSTTTLTKTDSLVYEIYNEFIATGHIPWYMGYEELGHIFDSAKEFADANVGTNPEVTQLIASVLARDPKDRTKYYRTTPRTEEEMRATPPAFVPLMSVQYAATNTTTKLGGSYFSKGVVSALIDPSERQENIEMLLVK